MMCQTSFHKRVYQEQHDVSKRTCVFCANCGGFGHVYKTCNHPVISYGVICYKTFYDPVTNSVYPKYLMVQRRDSLSYVEFLRGKYKLNNKQYIMKLFTNMTPQERETIKNHTFTELWDIMWCKRSSDDKRHNTSGFNKEWKEAADKFDSLKKGYYIVEKDNQEKTWFDIAYIIDNTEAMYSETEWGFPKGRRNINEDDMTCALREFKEETGVPSYKVRVARDVKPIEEIFLGSNNIRYKHVYYVAKYMTPVFHPAKVQCDVITHDKPLFDPENQQQTKEVRDVQWFTYQEAQDKIRECNIERKELFKRLNHVLMKSFCHA